MGYLPSGLLRHTVVALNVKETIKEQWPQLIPLRRRGFHILQGNPLTSPLLTRLVGCVPLACPIPEDLGDRRDLFYGRPS